MAIHDYVIANQNGANTRSDLNNAFSAIVSNNSSATEPTTTYAYQWWADTGNDLLKQRNAADSAWISILTLSTGAVSNAAIADDAVTLAKMAAGTDGELITYDTSGDPTTVPTGSSGEVLTSNGAGTTPTFQTAGGGKVLQVVGDTDNTKTITSSTSFVDTNVTKSITPSSISSRILVLTTSFLNSEGSNTPKLTINRGSTNLGQAEGFGACNASGSTLHTIISLTYLDSPNTISSVTYTLRVKSSSGSAVESGSSDKQATITLIEIGA